MKLKHRIFIKIIVFILMAFAAGSILFENIFLGMIATAYGLGLINGMIIEILTPKKRDRDSK